MGTGSYSVGMVLQSRGEQETGLLKLMQWYEYQCTGEADSRPGVTLCGASLRPYHREDKDQRFSLRKSLFGSYSGGATGCLHGPVPQDAQRVRGQFILGGEALIDWIDGFSPDQGVSAIVQDARALTCRAQNGDQ